MSEPQVTIAVVSWNTRELLGRCLESMRAPVEAGLARVVVVDNVSADGSAALVRERFTWAELIEAERNLGYGAAVNAAVEGATTPWLAPANADVELRPGALEALLAAGRDHPEAGLLAPTLLLPGGSVQHSVHAFPSLELALAFNLGLGAAMPRLGDRLCLDGRWDPARAREIDWAHGAFVCVRRVAFEAIGGFDAGQWMYAEDLDLAWRLAEAGWARRFVPAARVGHEVAAATGQRFGDDERAAAHMAAAQDWLRRRRGRVGAAAYAAINALGSALRLLALVPLARVSRRRFAARRELERRYLRLHAAALRR
jgi:N-acetylglucosaminyl-diphospho-decaprenol L-rhamnosyltransferase